MRKNLVFTALLIVFSGLFSILFGQESQFHPFVNDKKLCAVCHLVYDINGTDASYIVVKADSSRLPTDVCLECHPHRTADHPVQIKAPFPVPKDLPLSKNKEITCVTCHNPHFSRFSDRPWITRSFMQELFDFLKMEKEYKTYFLRRNNANGDLCHGCHKRLRQHFTW